MDNSYHIVTGSGVDTTATLEGFTITGGNADNPTEPDASGSDLICFSGKGVRVQILTN